jgi:hypothetical protein
MFIDTPLVQDRFGRHYYICGFGNASPLSVRAKEFHDELMAGQFVRGLDAPYGLWNELLHRYDVSGFHRVRPFQSIEDGVAQLLLNRHLMAYPVISPSKLNEYTRSTTFPKDKRSVWQIQPINIPPKALRPGKVFKSEEDALAFLKALNPTSAQIKVMGKMIELFHHREGDLDPIAYAIARGHLLIVETPIQPGRKAQKDAGPPEEPIITGREVSLGPHEEADYVPDEPPEPQPPQSLEACEQRLDDARKRLINDGYQPKYSDKELLAQAQTGQLDDRFVVRFTQTRYAADNYYLGPTQADGSIRYWSTTFNQLENADTDPETICAVLGINNYNPNNDYTLVVVDTQAKGAGESVTLVPTHQELGKFAAKEIEGLDPDRVKEVMTPEYNEEYAAHMGEFNRGGWDLTEEDDVSGYADEKLTSADDVARFETRAQIQRRLGANEEFTGDGTTKNLLNNGSQCGVVETFTYDKNPQTLAKLEINDGAKRIAAKPL